MVGSYPHRPGNLTVVVRSSAFAPVVGVMPLRPRGAATAKPRREPLRRPPADWARSRSTTASDSRKAAATRSRSAVPVGGTPGALRGLLPVRPRHRSATACSTAATNALRGDRRRRPRRLPRQRRRQASPTRTTSAPSSAGGANFGGCPDADGDGVPEGGQDKCPSHQSCSREPQRQEAAGRLPGHSAAFRRRSEGCHRHGQRHPVHQVRRGTRCRRARASSSSASCQADAAVAGSRSSARRPPPAPRCGRRPQGTSRFAASPVGRCPYGTTITIRVTARYAAGRFIRLKVVRSGSRLSEQIFCMRPGSKKLRKRGCA